VPEFLVDELKLTSSKWNNDDDDDYNSLQFVDKMKTASEIRLTDQ